MTRARAADGRLQIDGINYAYRSINRRGSVNPIEVANSEGVPGNVDGIQHPGFASVLPDIRSCEFTVSQAMFDDEDNPYAVPIALVEGSYYQINWFPTGLAGPEADLGLCLCVETSEQGTVGQGALIPSARFRSDTLYTAPGEGT